VPAAIWLFPLVSAESGWLMGNVGWLMGNVILQALSISAVTGISVSRVVELITPHVQI